MRGRNYMQNEINLASAPADPQWLTTRLGMLYGLLKYKRNVDDEVNDLAIITAVNILAPYPAWAVDRACWWWAGGENPNSAWIPDEGELERRCKEYMLPIDRAKQKVANYDEVIAEFDLGGWANDIANGKPPPLAEFDAWMAKCGIDTERQGKYGKGRVSLICWNMRKAILDAMGDAAPVLAITDDAPRESKPVNDFDADKEIDRLLTRHEQRETKRKRKSGWKPIDPLAGAGAVLALAKKEGRIANQKLAPHEKEYLDKHGVMPPCKVAERVKAKK